MLMESISVGLTMGLFTFIVVYPIFLTINILLSGTKMSWFFYWLIHGKGHPDHIKKCRDEINPKRKE